jgi:uncharacterized protein YdhG (YjbR/CyaY superfamily)
MFSMKKPTSVDDYISWFPASTQKLLKQMRATIVKNSPGAEEVISYAMPAYRLNGMLVYFAAFENHIGFYPTGRGVAAFKNELARYKSGKGSIQFPIGEPLPIDLISALVKFRVAENLEKKKQK